MDRVDEDRGFKEVFLAAYRLYQEGPHWLAFYEAVFGLEGLIRRAFPEKQARELFQQTELYIDLFLMLVELRGEDDRESVVPVGTRLTVLTIRLPVPVYRALKVEAHERQVSLNRLSVSKLLKPSSAIRPARVCRLCGCTAARACDRGCYWVEEDLCSRCAGREEDGTCPDD